MEARVGAVPSRSLPLLVMYPTVAFVPILISPLPRLTGQAISMSSGLTAALKGAVSPMTSCSVPLRMEYIGLLQSASLLTRLAGVLTTSFLASLLTALPLVIRLTSGWLTTTILLPIVRPLTACLALVLSPLSMEERVGARASPWPGQWR